MNVGAHTHSDRQNTVQLADIIIGLLGLHILDMASQVQNLGHKLRYVNAVPKMISR